MTRKGTGLLISCDGREREHLTGILGLFGWEAVCVESLPAALRVFTTTSDVDAVLLSENLRGLSLPTALRVLQNGRPHLPVLLVLPEERLSGFAFLPCAGVLDRWATAGEAEALLRPLQTAPKPEAPVPARILGAQDTAETRPGGVPSAACLQAVEVLTS